jgi:hypothetical protein
MKAMTCGRLPTILAAALSVVFLAAGPQNDPLAPTGKWTGDHGGAAATPPMGWNSWNAFRTNVDEEKVLGSADALLKTGLARKGYIYVNVDDGWWLKRRTSDGRLEIRTSIFPSARLPDQTDTSFAPFVDRIHRMGLKAGIYTDIGRNACSQAWDLHSPNLPVGTTAEREVGLEGHVGQDIPLYFKDWGFDYIKIDACGMADFPPGSAVIASQQYRPRDPLIIRGYPLLDKSDQLETLYRGVAAALERSRPEGNYVLSICTWGRANVRSWGNEVGNAWRTSADIQPRWSSMLHTYDSVVTRALYARPGSWNDPDMLYVGTGDFDVDHLTEARTHFTLWAMVNAPLLIGYDLRNAPKALLDILGNADLIAVNQDKLGNQAVLAYRSDDLHILVKTLDNGNKAVALFNRSDRPTQVTLTSEHLKFAPRAPITLTNLWTKKTLPAFTGATTLELAPRETLAFEAKGTRLIHGVYLSEVPARIHVASDGVPFPELDPEISRASNNPTNGSGPSPEYGGWGGAQPDASPYSTPLAAGERSFASGIGVLANSRLEVRANKEFARFSAIAGVDNVTRNRQTSIKFLVYGDGRLLAETRGLKFGDPPVAIGTDVRGISTIELIAKNADDTSSPVAAIWGDARLER